MLAEVTFDTPSKDRRLPGCPAGSLAKTFFWSQPRHPSCPGMILHVCLRIMCQKWFSCVTKYDCCCFTYFEFLEVCLYMRVLPCPDPHAIPGRNAPLSPTLPSYVCTSVPISWCISRLRTNTEAKRCEFVCEEKDFDKNPLHRYYAILHLFEASSRLCLFRVKCLLAFCLPIFPAMIPMYDKVWLIHTIVSKHLFDFAVFAETTSCQTWENKFVRGRRSHSSCAKGSSE